MTNSTKSTADQTIAALINQLRDDAAAISDASTQATAAIAGGNRNGAIGALLIAEAEIERIRSLFDTIRALHRTL